MKKLSVIVAALLLTAASTSAYAADRSARLGKLSQQHHGLKSCSTWPDNQNLPFIALATRAEIISDDFFALFPPPYSIDW